jgi:hypothetical protein
MEFPGGRWQVLDARTTKQWFVRISAFIGTMQHLTRDVVARKEKCLPFKFILYSITNFTPPSTPAPPLQHSAQPTTS